jgi:hypothetical protein
MVKGGYMTSLKKIIFAPAVLLLVITSAAQLTADSKIHFASTEYDFGKVPAESIQIHIFEFTNRGKSTLTIDRVSAG